MGVQLEVAHEVHALTAPSISNESEPASEPSSETSSSPSLSLHIPYSPRTVRPTRRRRQSRIPRRESRRLRWFWRVRAPVRAPAPARARARARRQPLWRVIFPLLQHRSLEFNLRAVPHLPFELLPFPLHVHLRDHLVGRVGRLRLPVLVLQAPLVRTVLLCRARLCHIHDGSERRQDKRGVPPREHHLELGPRGSLIPRRSVMTLVRRLVVRPDFLGGFVRRFISRARSSLRGVTRRDHLPQLREPGSVLLNLGPHRVRLLLVALQPQVHLEVAQCLGVERHRAL